ncbi:hypothetical protein [Streptomyces uncialis]|uniref:hypothetical protein n=1 Tax=Streptomyces uncialis TaxID=1048205 RepID=UPI0033EB3696
MRVAASAATIRRIVGLVRPGGLADLTGADPAGSESVALDGKAARDSRHGQTPAAHLLAAMTGDGRREIRVTRALTVTDLGLDLPHAAQAVRILRHRTDRMTGTISRQTVHAITDLSSHQASPQRLDKLARSQWTIENRLRFVRDTTFAEDASKIRTGHGPESMSTLRNLAGSVPPVPGQHGLERVSLIG